MCGSQHTGKFFKRWGYENTLLSPERQQLELYMEQWIGSKLGKEYNKAVYCQPAYLTAKQSMSCKMPSWMNHKPELRLPGEISTTSDNANDTTLMTESEEELKSFLMRVKEESEKSGLKNIQKTKFMASSPITSWQIEGEKLEALTDFIFLGSKITVDGDCSHEIKKHLLFGRNGLPL